jgi:hypothetical protein
LAKRRRLTTPSGFCNHLAQLCVGLASIANGEEENGLSAFVVKPITEALAPGKNLLNKVLLFRKGEPITKQIEIELKYLLVLVAGNRPKFSQFPTTSLSVLIRP